MAKEKEPITPFIAKIRALGAAGVSCILVIGGSGDYFDVADSVMCMEAFKPRDVTAEAHAIAHKFGAAVAAVNGTVAPFGSVTPRTPTVIYPAGTSHRLSHLTLTGWVEDTHDWPSVPFPIPSPMI